jgi:hypothetical protein
MASRIELPIYNDQNVAIRQINSTNQIIPLTISPNPAQTYINIDLGDQLNGSILIYDALGQVVLQSDNTNQNLVPLRIGQLAAGVYRVEYIQTTSTKRKIGSFIKK